jgi:chromosome segregation ATPase
MTDTDIKELRNDIKNHGERLARVETGVDLIHKDVTSFRGEVSGVKEELARQSNLIAGIQAKWALIGSMAAVLLGLVVKLLT